MLTPKVKIPNLPLLSAADLIVSNETSKLRIETPADSHSADEYSDAAAQAPDNADGRDYDNGDYAGRQSDEFSPYISQTDQASQTTGWIDRQRLSTIPKNLSNDECLRAIKHLTFQLQQRNPSLLQMKQFRSNQTLSTTCVPRDEERPIQLHSSEDNAIGIGIGIGIGWVRGSIVSDLH